MDVAKVPFPYFNLGPLFGERWLNLHWMKYFTSPKPYLPMGTLRDQIIYPDSCNVKFLSLIPFELLKNCSFRIFRRGKVDGMLSWIGRTSFPVVKATNRHGSFFHHRPAFGKSSTNAPVPWASTLKGLMYKYARKFLKLRCLWLVIDLLRFLFTIICWNLMDKVGTNSAPLITYVYWK